MSGTCTVAGQAAPVSGPGPTGPSDFLEGGRTLSIALADGAQVHVPAPPNNQGDWEMRIELEHGRESGGPPVASDPPYLGADPVATAFSMRRMAR